MAGHSKWANIKFRKEAQDAKRGKVFTKLIREISVAARIGGPDEAANSRLRDVVTKALKANMKRDTVDNAIARGAGGADNDNMVEMRYEGYGPSGIAILVDCLSDNKNRTVSEVRHAFTKYGGNLGTDGSVAYLFKKQGEILLSKVDNIDKAMECAIDAGADDVSIDSEQIEIISTPEAYHSILDKLASDNISVEHSHIVMRAQTTIALDGDHTETAEKLINALEDLDDVQNVYTNAEGY
jgi:YebC/PmpR family DNA-binding regulatory protein